MKLRKFLLVSAGAAVGLTSFTASKITAAEEIFFPLLTYATGPYASNGIPTANGLRDYLTLLQIRDGGINGVKIAFELCETKYNTKLAVECYERLKKKGSTGAVIVNPFSTGATYQLIPKGTVDKIPIHSMGYGRTAAGDGRVFKWAFTAPASYWSQASAFIKYIGDQEGGLDKLKGKKLALVYHNSPYGKEPIPTLEALSKMYGYDLQLLAVDHPGQEQKSTWLKIRRYKPDYIFLWGWGVMNQVAIKEAISIRFPMERFIGVWWSGAEPDVEPSGTAAAGYKSATFNGVGTDFDVHGEILKHVYKGDEEEARENKWGEVLYNRGLVNMLYSTEAARTAMERFGNRPVTGEEVRWGMENLNLTAEKIEKLGFKGLTLPHRITCADHEGEGSVIFQQWDGERWKMISKWYKPMRDLVRGMIEAEAAKFAKENNITPRDCG